MIYNHLSCFLIIYYFLSFILLSPSDCSSSSAKKMGFQNSILFIILSITLSQYVLHLPVAANYELTQGDMLNSSDSKSFLTNGMFTLGFFIIYESTPYIYLGIWFTNEDRGMKVWVANRDTPINGSGALMIDDSGTLKVVDENGITLFNVFYNQVGSGNKTRAVLEDSGNFIVYGEATDQNNRTVWQSFDHPTDALINRMKIGYNLTTKQNWTLTSSLSHQLPASGAFTMRLEKYNNSARLLIYRREERYWASGPWTNGTLPVINSLFSAEEYRFDLIYDHAGIYLLFRYTSNLQLTPTGLLIDGWSNRPLYDPVDFCFGYQLNDGCTFSALPYCRPRIPTCQWKRGYSIREADNIDDNQSISIGDCMKTCWNDCNCKGCSTNANGTGCLTWTRHKSFVDIQDDDGSGNTDQAYVLVSYQHDDPKSKTWIWIVVSLTGMIPFVYIAYLCCVRIRRRRLEAKEIKRRDDFIHQLIGSNSFNFGDELEKGFRDAPDVKIFSLKAILAATNDFSNDNKLGQGGYGPVYKGELFDGRKIAVKQLSKASGQGILEFKSELILISKLQHKNLVRLYGCCIHQEEKMLIYEYMPNKSLDFFLFDEDRKEKIDWQIRFNIIEGIIQGLLYLHKYSRMMIIHRDLKVSNILLDENMNPKIADFGMARIFHSNMTEETTQRIVGTYGYMAPEYMQGTFSIKSDVFSFGVLVLEIISGKKNLSFYKYDMPLTLVGYSWELWKRGASLELKDGALGESYDVKQLLRCIHVGLLCVQENANDRPTMSEVIYMLNNENLELHNPKKPAFYTQPNDVQSSKSTEHLLGNNIQVSVNSLTLTTMEAR